MKSTRTELSRRDFLKTTAVAGAGLTLSFTIPGAGARMLLTEAAAKQMNVAVADCVAEDGRIRHLPTGRSMPYGEIVAKVPITRTLSEEDLKKIELKKPSQYRIIGKWIPRLDIPEKVTGKAKFGIDTFLPGMVYAKVAYPPTREGGRQPSRRPSREEMCRSRTSPCPSPSPGCPGAGSTSR